MARPMTFLTDNASRPGRQAESPFAGLDDALNFPGAVCATVDPELWFPDASWQHGHTKDRQLTANSRAVRSVGLCHTCPHETACADYAVSQRVEYGVWGGLTEEDRQTIWTQGDEAA